MAATVTRRAVLAGSTTTAALGVLGAGIASAPAAAPSSMALRIEAHRLAHDAFGRVSDELSDLDALMEAHPITVTVEKGDGIGKPLSIVRDRLAILDEIAADLRSPGYWMGDRYDVEAMGAEFAERRARYDRNMAALKAADAEKRAFRDSLGFDEAEARWSAAQEADAGALDALVREPAHTLADVQARARYLVAADLVGRISDDEKRVRDLILSMTGEEA